MQSRRIQQIARQAERKKGRSQKPVRASYHQLSDDVPYTRVEAMQYLRLKRATFSKLTNGKIKGVPPLPFVRVGRRQLFRKAALDQWLIDAEAIQCNAVR